MLFSSHLVTSSSSSLPEAPAPALLPSLRLDEAVRRAVLLDAVRIKGSEAIAPVQADQSPPLLLQLPRELLFAVLECLSPARATAPPTGRDCDSSGDDGGGLASRRMEAVRAVANVRLTCSALFVAAEASGVTRDAVVARLAAWTSALMTQLTPKHSTAVTTGMEEEEEEDAFALAADLPLEVSVAAQALRASIAVGGRRFPRSVLRMVEQCFDPETNGLACFITARTVVDLPAAFAVLSEGRWDEVVKRAFAAPLVWGPHHTKLVGGEEGNAAGVQFYHDSWTYSRRLELGPLEPVVTEQELDDVVASIYKDAKPQPTSEVVGLLAQLVGVSSFMMWRDTTSLSKNVQLVLVGATTACVLHIQYNVDYWL